MSLSLEALIKSVKKEISQARMKKAFRLLDDYVKNDGNFAEAEYLGLKQKFRANEKGNMLGTINHGTYMQQSAQVTQGLLQFLDTLAEGPMPDVPSPIEPDMQGGDASEKSVILFLAANPEKTGHLKLSEEFRDVKEGLKSSLDRNLFDIDHLPAARSRDLRDGIRQLKPRIVHFSGHGLSAKELGAEEGARALTWAIEGADQVSPDGPEGLGIALQNNDGSIHLVKNETLATLFSLAKEHVEVVVFNNCYSKAQAEAVHKHIPYVVGMRRAVPDTTAIAFSVEFYKVLGDGLSVPEAFAHAQLALEMDGLPGADIPILLGGE